MIKTRTITAQEAAEFKARLAASPKLTFNLGEEKRFSVARVGYPPPGQGPLEPHFETTDDKLYRLPVELGQWAYDLVAVSITSGVNVFPTPVVFGRHEAKDGGRYWAEIL